MFVEYRLTDGMSAQVGYVGHHATHLVTPVEGNQALPGVGRPVDLGAEDHAPAALPAQPLVTTIATTALASGSKYNSMQASVRQRAWQGPRVPGLLHARQGNHQQPRLLRRVRRHRTAGGHSATEGAYWQNTYDPEAEWGPAFHDVRHNFVFSATYELPFGKGRKWGSDWSAWPERDPRAAGRWAASSRRAPGFPSPSSTAAPGRCRASAAPSGRTASATPCRPISRSTSGSTSPRSRRRRSGRSATARSASHGRRATRTSTSCSRSASRSAATRYLEFRVEAFNLFNHPSFGPPARDISVPNTFGMITNTISSPRVIELVLKFYF